MRSHVNTALWDAETRKEHTEWLLSFFDSIAAYFFKKTPQLHPVSGWFLRKAPQLHPVSGRFWVSGSGIASAFKSGCDDFLLHCIWEWERRKRGARHLLQAVDIVLRHLGTAFAIHTRRNDATGIACSFATREKPPQAHVLQGFAVA